MPLCAAPPCFPSLCRSILLHAVITFPTFPWLCDRLYPQSPHCMGIPSLHICLFQGLTLFKARQHGWMTFTFILLRTPSMVPAKSEYESFPLQYEPQVNHVQYEAYIHRFHTRNSSPSVSIILPLFCGEERKLFLWTILSVPMTCLAWSLFPFHVSSLLSFHSSLSFSTSHK